ncbi:MAG: HEAT repeat domain-containing protein [Acidobacteria bacterium]|nr:HEAT repeat domain-containing protein [Acidobacteriota bacterium]
MKTLLTVLAVVVGSVGSAQQRFDDAVRNLRNPDPKARASALALLAEVKHLEAIEPIAPLVNDPIDEIQLAAIGTELSFYLVDDVTARKRVAFIVERRNAGRAQTAFMAGPLAVWPRPVPVALSSALLKAIDDENPRVRVEAIYTLGAIARPPLGEDHTNLLIKALDHYDPAIRTGAARVIGRLGIASAGEALIKTVNDSQQSVGFAAMRALGDIRSEAAVQSLTEQLAHYRKGEGGWVALDALARIAHGSSVRVFKERLTDRDPDLRRAAAEGLARAADSSEVAALETIATNDDSEMVRAAAAFALQKLGRNYVGRLVEPLDSAKMATQIAEYFTELGQPVAPSLASYLKDPDDSIRGHVALILGAIGTSADVAVLEPLLQDRSADVRRAAERAILRVKVRGV